MFTMNMFTIFKASASLSRLSLVKRTFAAARNNLLYFFVVFVSLFGLVTPSVVNGFRDDGFSRLGIAGLLFHDLLRSACDEHALKQS